MRDVSLNFNNLERADVKKIYVKINWNGSTVITPERIVSFEISETFSNTNGVTIGGTFSSMCSLVLDSGDLALSNVYFIPYASYDNTEWVPLGRFYVTDVEINQDGMAEVTAYDKMAFLEDTYEYLSAKQMSAIVSEIATINSFTVESTVYPYMDALPPLEEEISYRTMLGYVAGLLGKNAIFNRDGKLEFRWYKASDFIYGDANLDGEVDSSDLTYIANNLMMKTHDGEMASLLGTMKSGKAILGTQVGAHPNTRLADVNDDGIVTASDVAEIQAYLDGEPYDDTLVGTEWHEQELNRDSYIEFTKQTDSLYEINCLISGTEENPITSGSGRSITFGNPYMTQSRLDAIKNDVCPFTVFPAEVDWLPFMSWEIGDITAVLENGSYYRVPIMSQTITYDGGLSGKIQAYGISDEKIKVGTQTQVEREIERNIGDRVKNAEEIANTISKELGGTVEFLKNADGSNYGITIWNQSKNAGWIWTQGGLGYFTGQAILPSSVAIDMYGNINANYITTGKLSADHISAGTIEASVVAKNLTMEGGTINLETSTDTNDAIALKFKRTSGDTEYLYSSNVSATRITSRLDVDSTINCYTSLGCNAMYMYRDGTSKTLSINNGSLSIDNSAIATESFVTSQGYYSSLSDITAGRLYLKTPYAYSTSQTAVVFNPSSLGQLGYVSSSRRYKKDIEDVKDIDPHVLYDLDVRQFKYKDEFCEEDSRDVLQIGFIAEEVEEIFPQGATYMNGQVESWGERNFIPAMLKLIQEQKNEIDELKARIETLERSIE